MTSDRLYQDVLKLYENRSQYIHAMKSSQLSDASGQITALLKKLAGIGS